MIFFRRVVGHSMEPTLKNGQFIICLHTRKFAEGQIVIAFHRGKDVIKRIKSINKGQIFLAGDNKDANHDSGNVPDKNIDAVVIWPRNL